MKKRFWLVGLFSNNQPATPSKCGKFLKLNLPSVFNNRKIHVARLIASGTVKTIEML